MRSVLGAAGTLLYRHHWSAAGVRTWRCTMTSRVSQTFEWTHPLINVRRGVNQPLGLELTSLIGGGGGDIPSVPQQVCRYKVDKIRLESHRASLQLLSPAFLGCLKSHCRMMSPGYGTGLRSWRPAFRVSLRCGSRSNSSWRWACLCRCYQMSPSQSFIVMQPCDLPPVLKHEWPVHVEHLCNSITQIRHDTFPLTDCREEAGSGRGRDRGFTEWPPGSCWLLLWGRKIFQAGRGMQSLPQLLPTLPKSCEGQHHILFSFQSYYIFGICVVFGICFILT